MVRMPYMVYQINQRPHPPRIGVDFPRDFQIHVRGACKQMFRVFGHIYHSHYDKILHMSCEGHLNTLFAHFYSFCKEFDLLEKKELAPMADFITELETSGRA